MKQERLENILIVYMKKFHGNGNFIGSENKRGIDKVPEQSKQGNP